MPENAASPVLHQVVQPSGYFYAASGDPLPWFANDGSAIVLLCHADGSVTWERRDVHGERIEPEARTVPVTTGDTT